MNNDTYILLKDLPYVKAGTEYISADDYNVGDKCSYVPSIIGMKHSRFAIHIDWIEDNPEWFKLKEQEKPKEWEILEYGYRQNNDNKPDQQYISKVKRLSDGEVFSIGDKIEEMNGVETIIGFELRYDGTQMWCYHEDENKYGSCISLLEKVRIKEQDVFQWTDELVAEFTTWSLTESPTMQGRYADIEQFKQSKSTPTKIEDVMELRAYRLIGNKVVPENTFIVFPTEKYEAVKKAIEQTLNQ